MRRSVRICFALTLCFAFPELAIARQPNVVVFLTDDQGWGDLSINGNSNLSTPNVDSLARDGARFDNFYVCAVCAPTRAEFLTGRYHPRTGVNGVSTGQGRLNRDEMTIADVFRSAGYATGAFGKWHNGTQSPYHPNDRGFDEFYGFTSGHWGHYFSPPLDHNGKKVRGKGYVVDDFTDHAMKFMQSVTTKNEEQGTKNPFFIYLPYNTPHSPMMIGDEFYDKFKDLDPAMKHRDPKREDVMMTRAALAMCENIDWNVGRVLKQLDELKLSDDTIVLYFSDNGPNSWRWNGGMKGKKSSVDEGGLRSPLHIRWPGKIKSGAIVPQVTAAIDLLPTLTGMAGIAMKPAKPLDGRSFGTLLLDESAELPQRDLFSVWRKRATVRTERFRLDSAGKLYDIRNDRGQSIDVFKKHPQEAARLRKAVAKYKQEMDGLSARFANRPFTVGYAKSTTLPARDGVPHGTLQRSSKAPNNSFFENWTSTDDSITWDIEVGKAATYEATVYYTCAQGDVGAHMHLSTEGKAPESTEQLVTEAFDPPLYDKSKERVEKSHYLVKDFKPLRMDGPIKLEKGRTLLRLRSLRISGQQAIDVHSIELVRR
ncbi:MAG: arylsulfatase A-like enzyme [Limisphaerales bacterium]|jgi:arylsulfatase A-like enzyme